MTKEKVIVDLETLKVYLGVVEGDWVEAGFDLRHQISKPDLGQQEPESLDDFRELSKTVLQILKAAHNIPDGLYARAKYLANRGL